MAGWYEDLPDNRLVEELVAAIDDWYDAPGAGLQMDVIRDLMQECMRRNLYKGMAVKMYKEWAEEVGDGE